MRSEYPRYPDQFPRQLNNPDGKVQMSAEDINTLQDAVSAIQTVLGMMPQGASKTVAQRIEDVEEGKIGSNVPLSLVAQVIETPNGSKELEVSWSYLDIAQIDYFILEVYNEKTGQYEPYDGQLGIVKK